MRNIVLFFVSLFISISAVSGQDTTGTLKVFAEEPVIVFVDQVQYPDYKNISLVPGTHYVKAINKDEVRVYSEIVTIKAGEVTSVLIESPVVQAPVPQQAKASVQPATQPDPKPKARPAAESAAKTPEVPKQTIDIGQTAGKIPADMSGAFGLSFGMHRDNEADKIMTPKCVNVARPRGDYYSYALPSGESFFLVECRFLDAKLFQILVGYPTLYMDGSKLKLDKNEIPFAEFNNMYHDLVAQYGEPATAEKIFKDGYTEDDGRMLEALKKKKAFILYTWVNPENGNNIMLTMAYTTAPVAMVAYTNGPLGAEAQKRKIKIHGYNYTNTYKENYFND